jgi:L-amino acid N-acyltransferase YncA
MMYRLRLADPADLPAIVDIYNSTVASRRVTADTEPVPLESRFMWFKAHQRPNRPLWVAEPYIHSTDGIATETPLSRSILGWMSFSDFYGRPAYRHSAELSIYCHENIRHRGLGSFLMHTALKTAPELEIKSLLAFVFGHNEPALGLFEKFGFQRWAQMPGVAELDHIERDLIILGKRLT